MSYDPYKKQGFEFETNELEDHRTQIVHELIGGEETLPQDVLDNDESVSLSINFLHP